MEIITLECPSCAANVSSDQKKCKYCSQPVVITTFSSIAAMPLPQINKYAGAYRKTLVENPDNQEVNLSIGICYLRLKLYDKALAAFEKAMEDNFEDAEPFFLAAVSLLQGKKPFVTLRPVIDKMEEYLNAAIAIAPSPVHYYFLSYIKKDYYGRKFFKTSPTEEELFATAIQFGLTEGDVEAFHQMIGVPH